MDTNLEPIYVTKIEVNVEPIEPLICVIFTTSANITFNYIFGSDHFLWIIKSWKIAIVFLSHFPVLLEIQVSEAKTFLFRM